VLKEGNHLRVYLDKGDAWNMRDDYRNQPEVYMSLLKREVASYGPLTEIKSWYAFKESRLQERMVLSSLSPIIEIYHEMDWKNLGYMVRAGFVPAEYGPEARSDIQFGYLSRSTGEKTRHEQAQFEVCSQKWIDVSGTTLGLALLNNAKCGSYAKKGVIDLNLLRSTNYPCTASDQKPTSYSYAIFPHEATLPLQAIDEAAEIFNARFLYGKESGSLYPTSQNADIEVSAYKPSYDGKSLIIRLYEKSGVEATTRLDFLGSEVLGEETNLLEDTIAPAPEGALLFKPFQIRSFRVIRKS
jgi:alpha-mannosidase